MYTVMDLASYVVSRYAKSGHIITNLKLQKVLYYIQGYSLKRYGDPAFLEKIYKWPYGPVAVDAYFAYNENGAQPIPESENTDEISKKINTNQLLRKVTNDVIEKTYNYSAAKLVEMTHEEEPWKNAPDRGVITIPAITDWFIRHDPLELKE